MARRKAARTPRRASKKAPRKHPRQAARGRSAQASRKTRGRKAAAKKRATTRKKAGSKRAAPARLRAAKRSRKSARLGAKPRAAAKPLANKKTAKKPAAPRTRKVLTRPSAPRAVGRRPVVPLMRKPPGLDRERRIVRDEDDMIQSSLPSSLDLDRSASAVRTGRRVLKERFDEHTETSPALTAGDVDADWESAYSVGDEAPGGDNPTPDQDIVDDIGKAVGVEYQDNEELKGEEKITKRDRNRWELDPASSDDWDDR